MKNMSSSVGMMTFPTEWKKSHVPNHQPEYVWPFASASPMPWLLKQTCHGASSSSGPRNYPMGAIDVEIQSDPIKSWLLFVFDLFDPYGGFLE